MRSRLSPAIRNQPNTILMTLALAWLAFGAATARADLLISLGPVTQQTDPAYADQGQYYFDVTVTNNGSPLDVAAFSFGVSSSDSGVSFTESVGEAPPGSGYLGVDNYVFGGDGFFPSILPGYQNTSSGFDSTQLVAGDVLSDPNATVALSGGPTPITFGLGRVFFNYTGTHDALGLITSEWITLDENTTYLDVGDANQLTGTIEADPNTPGDYRVPLAPSQEPPTIPEPSTFVPALMALMIVGGAARSLRNRHRAA